MQAIAEDMTAATIKFRARVAKSGRNEHIWIPLALRGVVKHRALYLVTLEPLEEGEEHG